MAKFINKKEQVFDLKLTSYGHYLLSIGSFKPTYYAFYDDNVIYDQKYAYSGASENQNDVNRRITEDTAYIESLVLFRDVEETLNQNDSQGLDWFNQAQLLGRKIQPALDVFKFDASIGDAYLDGQTNQVPSWRLFSLRTDITSSTTKDNINNTNIPQINITSSYIKRVIENTYDYDPLSIRDMDSRTTPFVDNKVISITSKDPIFYVEELNTQLLSKNYEVEIFQVLTSSVSGSSQTLLRKFFRKDIPQIENGFMKSATPRTRPVDELTTGSVEYYFDVLTDTSADHSLACRGAEQFNKQSYYLDLGFNCDGEAQTTDFYDIYGSSTEPEICQD